MIESLIDLYRNWTTIWNMNQLDETLSLSNFFFHILNLETEIDQDIISYPWFSFFLESGTSYDSCLVGLFSSMWSWMSGWDPTTWKYVPTHPSNHMNLFNTPIGTSDKNLASWFELYRICFVTCLASRFLRFSSSSTFVCLVVFWKKEIDGDLAMKMSDHWDTLEHTWCVTAILNLRI